MLPEYLDLRNMDCMDLMAQYPDKHFDLAIVDPPYRIGYEDGGQYFNKSQGKKWDKNGPNEHYFIELLRVSKSQIIWGGNYFDLPPTRCVIAWTKTVELQDRTFSEWEMAWTSFDSVARWFDLKPFQRNGSRIHPTQKPVQLYKWLLKNYAKEGDKILDTHLGSMSIAIAVHEMNRVEKMNLTLVGSELDPDYYRDAMKRVEQHTKQLSLI